MTKHSLLLLVLVAACGKSSKTDNATPSGSAGSAATSGSAAPAPAAPAATAGVTACPEGDALTAKLAQIFKTKADDISNAGCVVGKFPQPSWWVTAYLSTETATVDRSAIVDAKGAIVSMSEDEIPPGLVDSSGSSDYRAIDFDKDGTDEVLYVFSSDRRGYAESGVHVTKLVKGKWEAALSRTFSYDSSAAVENESEAESCDATWEVDANLAIVFTPKGKATSGNTESCVLEKESWTLGADGKFAKAAPAAKPKK